LAVGARVFLQLANWEKFPIIHGCRRSAAACRTKSMKGIRIENRHGNDDRHSRHANHNRLRLGVGKEAVHKRGETFVARTNSAKEADAFG
jgi:hypothetical protein